MTIKAFCSKTGWPLSEIMQMYWSEFSEILDLYGLQLAFCSHQRRPKIRIHIKRKK